MSTTNSSSAEVVADAVARAVAAEEVDLVVGAVRLAAGAELEDSDMKAPAPNSQAFRRAVALLMLALLTSGCSATGIGRTGSGLKRSADLTESGTLSSDQRADVCLQTGLQLAAHEKDDHAITQLEKARELNPKLKGVAHPLAVLYDRQGRFGPAEREYERALQEEKNNADLLNDFGYFRYSQRRYEDARPLLIQARKLNPDHPRATINLAMVLAAEEDFDAAFGLFSEVVGEAAAHQNVGLLMLKAGREEEAIVHLESAADQDPSLVTAQTVLADYSVSPHSKTTTRTVGYEQAAR